MGHGENGASPPMRGKFDTSRLFCLFGGASPPMRGKYMVAAMSDTAAGCIPAHAGEMFAVDCCSILSRVHPRPCGGNAYAKLAQQLLKGASPPMRGKYARIKLIRRPARCIPAHAGEIRRRPRFLRPTEVHPRPCGGNLLACTDCIWTRGASPPMRGKFGGGPDFFVPLRCIPAHAGEMLSTQHRG